MQDLKYKSYCSFVLIPMHLWMVLLYFVGNVSLQTFEIFKTSKLFDHFSFGKYIFSFQSFLQQF